jgi:hypothetical protein
MSQAANITNYNNSPIAQGSNNSLSAKDASSADFNGAIASARLDTKPTSNNETLIALDRSKKSRPAARKTKSKQKIRSSAKKSQPKAEAIEAAPVETQAAPASTPTPTKVNSGAIRYGREAATEPCEDSCVNPDLQPTPPAAPAPIAPPPAPPVTVAPPEVKPSPIPMEFSIGGVSSTTRLANPIVTVATPVTTPNTNIPPTTTPIAVTPTPPPVKPEEPHTDRPHSEHRAEHGKFFRGEMPRFNSENNHEGKHGKTHNSSKHSDSNPDADCDTPAQPNHKDAKGNNTNMRQNGKRGDTGRNLERITGGKNRDGNTADNANTSAQTSTTAQTTTDTAPTPAAIEQKAPAKITSINRTGIVINGAVPISIDGSKKITGSLENGTVSTDTGGNIGYTQVGIGLNNSIPLGQSTTAVLGVEGKYVSANQFSGAALTMSGQVEQRLTAPESLIGIKASGGLAATASNTPIVREGVSAFVGAGVDLRLSPNSTVGIKLQTDTHGDTSVRGQLSFGR